MSKKKNKKKRKGRPNPWLLVKDAFLCSALGFLAIGLLSLVVVNMTFFNPLKKVVKDFSFLDVYYAENLDPNDAVDTDIVIINVERRDRFELAMLIEGVLAQQPKVVGLDMIFKELREPSSDSLLMTTLSDPRIVGSYIVDPPNDIYSSPYFDQEFKTSGFVNLNFDNQTTVIRSFAGTTLDIQDEPVFSFSSQIAHIALGEEKWQTLNYDQVLLGETPLSYYGNTDKFLTLDFDDFITLDNPQLLKDKIVLLGYLGVPTGNPFDVEDKHFTPLNKVTAGKSIPDMYGVMVHANIIHMLLNNKVMTRISNFWVGIWSFVLTFLLTGFIMYLRKRDRISFKTVRAIVKFVFTVIVTFIALLLFKNGVILNAVPLIAVPLLCSSFINYYTHLIDYIKSKRKWKSYVT